MHIFIPMFIINVFLFAHGTLVAPAFIGFLPRDLVIVPGL
jgi:hypothetical protein